MSTAVKVLAGLMAIMPILSIPADAQDYRYYSNNGRGYHRYHRYKRYDRANWKAQRMYLRNNMRNLTVAQQQALNAQMQAQFRAYHHNNWNGAYTWQNYSDPAFLDYLSNRNPTVLDTVFNYLGRY